MTRRDRLLWDEKYTSERIASDEVPGLPQVFAGHEALFPAQGQAIDLACGPGRAAVWLAARGLEVCGADVSPVAVRLARGLASRHGQSDRCRFEVVDLDHGIPDGPPADVVVCHFYRDPRLYQAITDRLAPGGLLAIAVLSEVGHGPGPFRAPPGELRAAFSRLSVSAAGEAAGHAWLLARS